MYGHKMWFNSTEKCMFLCGIIKMGQQFMILSAAHHFKALQQFHFAVFCPKSPPQTNLVLVF